MADSPGDGTAGALKRAVAGQFLLREEIGRGGMGVVFRAYDEQLARDVAIKTLPPHLALDAQVRARFLREARTAASLSHPNIVPIYSAAERDGIVYFAMGLVTGESLADRITQHGSLPVHEVVPILQELAAALGYAHSRGIVHRDVKAENVLMDAATGRAMVTDFGIARVAEAQPLTATGTVLGTVHYMSPEQVSGDAVDGRSDLYSLGVLAFFALTGRFPFERPTAAAVVVAHVTAPPPDLGEFLPSSSAALRSLIATMLAKSPGDRYAAALGEALDDSRLLHVTAEHPGDARPFSRTEAEQVWSRAAELQANTGQAVSPPSFTPRGMLAPLTAGFNPGLVKQSAIEAGIGEVFVEQALSEKAQVERAAMVVAEPGEIMQKRPGWFLGGRQKLEYTAALDGELGEEDFEEIADDVRRVLGEMISVSSVGRTLRINTVVAAGQATNSARNLQLTITSRKGVTQVRAFEDLTTTAAGWFMGLGFGGGLGVGAGPTGIVAATTHDPLLVIATALAALACSFSAARAFFMRSSRKRDAELQQLVRRVIEKASELLAARSGRDPSLPAQRKNRLLR
jgi:eukaryotic-like serine/threonine-protein kinase